MAQVKYTGGPDAVDVRVGEEFLHVERGQALEVPDDAVEQLVAQGWERVKGEKATASRGRSASKEE